MSAGSVWLSRPEGRRLVPPTVSSLLLSNTIMRGPCPPFSYLQKINGRGRGLVCLGGLLLCCWSNFCKDSTSFLLLDLIRAGLDATSRETTAGRDKSAEISRLAGSSPAVVASKENKLCPGRPETVLLYTVITTAGKSPATAEPTLTPKLPTFSDFLCCQKYRTALADCCAAQI